MFKNIQAKASEIYNEYPRTFWLVVIITFIDRVGGALIFPFFALYLTKKFGVGMTDVGVLSTLGFLSLHFARRVTPIEIETTPELT